jgi:hypothetical protein
MARMEAILFFFTTKGNNPIYCLQTIRRIIYTIKDIELTLDEIRRAKESAIKAQSGENSQEQPEPLADGELSEEELMDVAGGFTWEEIWDLVTAW